MTINHPPPALTLRGKPLSDPDALAKLRAFLKVSEPPLARWSRETWARWARELSAAEIAEMVATGQVSAGAAERATRDYTDFVNDRLAPRWAAALKAGRDLAPEGVRELLTPQVIAEWIDTRRPWSISQLTSAQANAVNAILRAHLTTQPVDQRTLAALLRPALGLTEQQARVLLKRQASLAAEGVAGDTARTILRLQATQMQRQRADRIARTELAAAHNGGTQITMERAADAGAFEGRVVKVWRAQRGRVCPVCAGLDNRVADLKGAFDGAYPHPPAHPTCRCVVLYQEVR